MKLSGNRTLQPPPEPVGEPHEERAATAEETLREARDRQDRHGDQHVLDDQERQRGRKQTKDRPQQHQERMKMVAQQVIAGPFDGNDRRLEARVCLDGLGENTQVPGGGDERTPLRHRVADVERADGAGNDGGQPPGRDQARGGYSIRALHPTISAGCVAGKSTASASSRAEAGAG